MKIGLSLLAFLISITSFGQFLEDEVEYVSDSVILKKEMTGGVILHNLGWGLNFRKGFNKTAFKRNFYEIEVVGMKHPKQIKTLNPWYVNAKSYVYGKENSVFNIRAGIGRAKQIARKPYWGGVEVRYFYSGGGSLSIAKPIYLYILKYASVQTEYDIVTERYNPDEHFLDNIFGRAPFTRGIGETRFYPGLYGKFGFTFEYGSIKSKIASLELGAVIEVFPFAVPIMAFNDPHNYFLTVYLKFSIGKRFNN